MSPQMERGRGGRRPKQHKLEQPHHQQRPQPNPSRRPTHQVTLNPFHWQRCGPPAPTEATPAAATSSATSNARHPPPPAPAALCPASPHASNTSTSPSNHIHPSEVVTHPIRSKFGSNTFSVYSHFNLPRLAPVKPPQLPVSHRARQRPTNRMADSKMVPSERNVAVANQIAKKVAATVETWRLLRFPEPQQVPPHHLLVSETTDKCYPRKLCSLNSTDNYNEQVLTQEVTLFASNG